MYKLNQMHYYIHDYIFTIIVIFHRWQISNHIDILHINPHLRYGRLICIGY